MSANITTQKEWFNLICRICRHILFFVLPAGAVAQAQGIAFNLNTTSGLPSNHIYGSITDRLGYLWIATPKGVVRYNGYEARVFTVSEGLPTEDDVAPAGRPVGPDLAG